MMLHFENLELSGSFCLPYSKFDYRKDSLERAELTAALKKLKGQLPVHVPISISGTIVWSRLAV